MDVMVLINSFPGKIRLTVQDRAHQDTFQKVDWKVVNHA